MCSRSLSLKKEKKKKTRTKEQTKIKQMNKEYPNDNDIKTSIQNSTIFKRSSSKQYKQRKKINNIYHQSLKIPLKNYNRSSPENNKEVKNNLSILNPVMRVY